jgi:hypothetical protein
MAHWAEVDENNIVVRVLVGDNNDPNNDEGYQWLIDNLGGRWIKTSYNGNIRKRYAGIGYTYDENKDAFIMPSPYHSWVLNEEICDWEPPISKPAVTETTDWKWDEETISWRPFTKIPKE